MNGYKIHAVLFCAVFIATLTPVRAQVPRTISFQGVLADAQGNLLPDGNHTLLLKLYTTATGGSAIYSESHTAAVVRGVFNVIIGSGTPMPESMAFDRAYFLGIEVNGGAELTPRTALTAVPYAMRAERATVAESLAPNAAGVVTSVNSKTGPITLQGGGGTTITNTGSTFTISSSGAGGTGIQGVQNIDGTIAIQNPNGPVATLGLGDNAIDGTKIADNQVVRSVNGLKDDVVLAAAGGGALSKNGDTIFVGGGGSGIQGIMNTDQALEITNPGGPQATINVAEGRITESMLAAGSVTRAKIAGGQVVKSMNFLVDDIQLVAGARINLSTTGNSITITGEAPEGVKSVLNTDNALTILDANGPATTVNIAPGGIASSHIAGGAVTEEKIADGAVTAGKIAPGVIPVIPASLPPSGAAGGDLTGTYPNPVIANGAVTPAKINSTGATNGQVLGFNGASVVWQSIAAGGVSGTGVANRLAFWSGASALTSDASFTLTGGSKPQLALGFQCSASGDWSTAIGSQCSASGPNSIAMGAGSSASGNGCVAIGVSATASGVRSWALGNFVTAATGGTFVIGDANTTNLSSTLGNQMSARFSNGYRFFTNASSTIGAKLDANATAWSVISDRNTKENFQPIDAEDILLRIRGLAITEWNYIGTDPSVRYIGPVAQDFYNAFHLAGTDSLSINSLAYDGVNLAAIQALEIRTAQLRETNAKLEQKVSEIAELQSRIDRLESFVESLMDDQPAARKAVDRHAPYEATGNLSE